MSKSLKKISQKNRQNNTKNDFFFLAIMIFLLKITQIYSNLSRRVNDEENPQFYEKKSIFYEGNKKFIFVQKQNFCGKKWYS